MNGQHQKKKNTSSGTTVAYFNTTDFTVRRNMSYIWKAKFFSFTGTPVKMLFTDDGKMRAVDEKGDSVWVSHDFTIF